MNDKMMILHFVRLLVENGEILINHKPIINIKTGKIEIINIDVKYETPFCQNDLIKKISEMGLDFDLLDLHIEEGFEVLEILRGKLGYDISIMISIQDYIVEQEYFVEWLKYIGEICEEFGIQKHQIIIEVKIQDTQRLVQSAYINKLMAITDEVQKKGYKLALPIESEVYGLRNNFIRIVDLNRSDIVDREVNEEDNILIRRGNCLKKSVDFKYKYLELDASDGDHCNSIY